jgi:release factor glutamine methyltransferase
MPNATDSMPASPRVTVVGRLRAAGCVFAEEEADLLGEAAQSAAALDDMVAQRVAGVPLEQILGWAQFCGLRIAVEPGVFVPRRRTEFLVQQAAALAQPGAVVVDLCCGSGAIGAAIAGRVDGLTLYCVDIDPAAVQCARRNVAGFAGEVFEGDLYDPLPATLRGRVDLLLANAPYVPTEEIGLMPPEARLHEPAVALDGGADGLDIQRRVAAAAPAWLAPGGHMLIETSRRQAPQTADAFTRSGLLAHVVTSDELSATVVVGATAAHQS